MIVRGAKGHILPKMTAADQRNAWMLYQAGFSTAWIAKRIYARCGYKNWRSCQAALFRAFRGRPVRTKKQAANARRVNGRCVGCRCLYDERTKGCNTCHRRFANDNRKGTVPAPNLVECSGCGCALDERTHGCKCCSTRHALRARRAEQSAAPASLADGRGGTNLRGAV